MPATPNPRPTLLTLPLEIRLQIYKIVFNRRDPHLPKQLFFLPSVCHQLRAEALPVLLRETRYFSSTHSLIRWSQRGRKKWLSCIRDVSISTYTERPSPPPPRGQRALTQFPTSLGDVSGSLNEADDDEFEDLNVIDSRWWERNYARKLAAIENGGNEMVLPISPSQQPQQQQQQQQFDYDSLARKVAAYAETVSATQPSRKGGTKIWKKWMGTKGNETLISALWKSLISIRSITTLRLNLGRNRINTSITAAEAMSNPDAEQEIFIQMVSLAIPNLRSLTLLTTLLSLPVLQHFQNLTHLDFSGHSLSSPAETLQILRSLPKLTSLSLGRGPPTYDKDHGLDTASLHKYQCITEEVLRGLNPLSSLRISHLTRTETSPFLSKSMLKAALVSHRHSLRELRLFSDCSIDGGAFQVLLDLLPGCFVLESINLVFAVGGPQGHEAFDISEYLPPSVKKKDILLRQHG